MRKAISIIFAFLLLAVLSAPVLAAADGELQAAERLYELGLFKGRGADGDGQPDFDLDTPATRQEAVIMLLRLMGLEDNAEAESSYCPFEDVDEWAQPYVGYAWSNELVQGRTSSSFDAKSNITCTEYITFILRALGYSSEEDFDWSRAFEKSDEIGLTSGEYGFSGEFDRGDMVLIACNALDTKLKWRSGTLFEYLNETGFTMAEINEASAAAQYVSDGEIISCPEVRIISTGHDGDSDCCVHMDDLWLLLTAASGEDMQGIQAPFTQQDIYPQQSFTPIVRKYGNYTVTADYRAAGMAYSEFTVEYSQDDGAGISFTEGRMRREGVIFFENGVRCYVSSVRTVGNQIYVDANDFLSYFGFDCTLKLQESADGGYVWSLESAQNAPDA